MFYEYSMTLRELLQSVDAETYASIPLYDELLNTKPEYGSNNRIKVKVLNGEIAVSNVHVGSLGDIVACPIDVVPDLQVTKMQLLDAILKEMSHVTFLESSLLIIYRESCSRGRSRCPRRPMRLRLQSLQRFREAAKQRNTVNFRSIQG